ncbi:MAG: TRAP transporter substrate-binding protein DctP [Rhodospirillales bacterium]|nr:TRAP transporter substrate-binding protein DctP [Rhodospirillales bacterium]
MQLAYLPMTIISSSKGSVALWRTYEKHFRKANEYKGVKLIGIWVHGGTHIFNSKSPITKIGDFKGMKFRATPGIGVDTFKMLGSSVVTSAGPQVFSLVSKKIVDGVAFPIDGILRFKIDKYLKYMTYIPGSIYNQSWSLIMNKQKWDGLSKGDQMAINKLSGEPVAARAGRIFDAKAKKAMGMMIKKGMRRALAS